MLMIQSAVFCLALVFAHVTSRSIDTSYKEVLVRDLNPSKVAYPPIVNLRIQRDECKRDVPPMEWNQRTQRQECQQDLVLRRRDNINTDFPMYKINKDGTPVKEQTTRALDGRAYQDAQNGAALFIKSEPSASGIYKRTVNGAIFDGEYTMYLEPSAQAIHRHKRSRPTNYPVVVHVAFWKRNELPDFGPDSIRYAPPTAFNKGTSTVKIDKRNGDTTYGVEIAMFCDYKCYNIDFERNEQEVRNHFSHLINGMDLDYATIEDPELSIYLRLVAVYIEKDFNPWTEVFPDEDVFVDGLLAKFTSWRVTMIGKLVKHDHAMLLTGYQVYGMVNGTKLPLVLGMSYIGEVCKDRSTSVFEISRLLTSMEISLASHELGHNLGSTHDGHPYNKCPPNDTYIMKSSTGNVNLHKYKNAYRFSPCSIGNIKKYFHELDKAGANCLRNTAVRGADIPEVNAPGQAFGPDRQCEQQYNSGYKYLKSSQADHLMCKNLYCTSPSEELWRSGNVPALPKTSCGDRKWCVYGDCVHDAAAPSMRIPGEEYDLDAQCEYLFGTGYRFPNRGDRSSVCKSLHCKNGSGRYMTGRFGVFGAFRGTPCGYNKWCINGECVEKGMESKKRMYP